MDIYHVHSLGGVILMQRYRKPPSRDSQSRRHREAVAILCVHVPQRRKEQGVRDQRRAAGTFEGALRHSRQKPLPNSLP